MDFFIIIFILISSLSYNYTYTKEDIYTPYNITNLNLFQQ